MMLAYNFLFSCIKRPLWGQLRGYAGDLFEYMVTLPDFLEIFHFSFQIFFILNLIKDPVKFY